MTRPTLRLDGENIGLGDIVTVSYVHESGPLIGLVGTVKRIRCYDEFTSDPVPNRLWIEDYRSGDLVEVAREAVEKIGHVDGPYLTQDEIRAFDGR